MHRGRWTIVSLVVGAAMLPTAVRAAPAVICHEKLVGVMQDGTRRASIAVRIEVRSIYGDRSILGRMRCIARRKKECIVDAALVRSEVFKPDPEGAGPLGFRIEGLRLTRRIAGGYLQELCELSATVPYMKDLCVPTITGTFHCDEDTLGSVSGVFGLAAESCTPCFFAR